MRRILTLVLLALLAGGSVSGATATGATKCTIRGTHGPDVLRGTDHHDVICGYAGNDTLLGRGGNDRLLGGGGDDTLKGGYGADVAKGGDGNDTFDPSPGRDSLYGQGGDDYCILGTDGAAGDHLYGGAGRDGYNVDPGDTRDHNFEYWIDAQYCPGYASAHGGGNGHGNPH